MLLSMALAAAAAPALVLQAGALPSYAAGTSVSSASGNVFLPTSYSTVNGSFAQDDPATNATTFDVYVANATLGLVGGDWANFTSYISMLNQQAPANTSYKVIFAARHGEGYHNTEESYVGTPSWNCYWSLVNGNGTAEWGPDALLTPLGISQAQRAHDSWKANLQAGAPLPQTFLASPLSRAASTLNITWSDQLSGAVPTFKELWRESIGLHTCDKRRTRSYLAATYPAFDFEQYFTEEDPLWTKDLQETSSQQALRIRRALDELFSTNPSVYISITAHSGTITGLLATIGHRSWSTQTGGLVPVVVKAVKADSGPTTTADPGPSQTAPPCTSSSASFQPNPSSIATTAPVSGSGVPASPSASASASFTA